MARHARTARRGKIFARLALGLGLLASGCAHSLGPACTPRIYPLRADSTIELTIGERTGHFLLDTGANVSALDPEWADTLTPTPAAEVVLPKLRLADVTIERPRFRVEPLHSSYIGTLGTDVLRRFVVTFDYRSSRVELVPLAEAAGCRPDPAGHQPVPFMLRHGVPVVALRVGHVTLAALLDTGAWYGFVGIRQPVIEQLGERLHFEKNVYILSARGRTLQPTFMGLPVRLGPIELHAPIVQDDANIVGLYILRSFGRFTIDFARSTLWVERAERRAL